jgi:hypothetical protein
MSDKIDSREQLLFILNERYIDQKNGDINDSEYKQSIDKYNDYKVESSSSLSSYDKNNNVLDRRGIVNKISNVSSLVSNRNKKKPVITHLHHHHNQYRRKQQINNSYISPYILLAEKRANDRIQIRRKYSSMNHNEHSQHSQYSNHNHNHNNHDDQNESKASVIKHKNGWNENVHIESSLFDPKLKKQEIFKIEPKVHYFYNKYTSKVNGNHHPHSNNNNYNNNNDNNNNNNNDNDDDDLSSNHSDGYNSRLDSYNNNSLKQKLTIKTNGVRTHFL